MLQTLDIKVDAMTIQATYDIDKMKEIFVPLFYHWDQLYREKGRRIIVFLAAPPGCGKTTLSLFLQDLSKSIEGIQHIQAIGMDGFHYHQSYLKSHNKEGTDILLATIKGSPETFDCESLSKKIIETKEKSQVLWPAYNRMLHDVEDDKKELTENIILLEGNYLLLKEEPWNQLEALADDTIFVSTNPDFLKERLVSRKVKSGVTEEYATKYYYDVDRVNGLRVIENSKPANTMLYMTQDGDFDLLKGSQK